MKSMTGFAKGQTEINGKMVTIEIKTLNSKQMDANVKLPSEMREHELEIRAMLNGLERGKIDFIISEENKDGGTRKLNTQAAEERLKDVRGFVVRQGLTVGDGELLSLVLSQSDLWEDNKSDELDESAWEKMRALIASTIEELDKTRRHEGEILKEDFKKHIDLIEHYLGEIPPYEAERIVSAKERMRSYLADAAVKDVDENRFEQELIYYLEKLDITEEKVRLAKHINYFREVMEQEEGSGKKLGFIAQEMGREINTTGSKANHVEIQRLVVAMKDELEKIKEQLGNIL